MLKPFVRSACVQIFAVAILHNMAAAQPAPVPPPVAQVQADCARPQYASDMLVCSDAELRAIDADVGALAAMEPSLAAGAIWETQSAWMRRRSQCAFNADHRQCLVAAYRDRKAVLVAMSAPAPLPLLCSGQWAGRAVSGSIAVAGQPVALRENGLLLAVATPKHAGWQPVLTWRPARQSMQLQLLDGRRMSCRPAVN